MSTSLMQRVSGPNRAVGNCTKHAQRSVRVFSAPSERKISRTDARFTGYQEQDSYGLTNIFPVEVKTYEAGSKVDTQDTFNTPLAGVAFVVAAAVISVGLVTLGGTSSPAGDAAEDVAQFQTLSQYRSKFQAELGVAVRAAPALVASSVQE